MGIKEDGIKLYNSGKTFNEISILLNKPMTSIWRLIKNDVIIRKLNDYREKLRTYSLDENFFEFINTRDKAYILGFLLADGHRTSKLFQIRLKLQERDKYILEKIKIVMGYDKPLLYSKKRKESHQNQFSLIICSRKICDDLEKFGIVKNKTFNITIPIIDNMLFIDLFRGYFDGDGW